MASIKVKFRPSAVAGNEGTIYYQIIHERKVRQICSDNKVFPEEWNDRRSVVAVCPEKERKTLILSIRECIRRDVERLTRIIRKMDTDSICYTADDVVEEFNCYVHEYSLFNFMEKIIVRLRSNGNIRTSETYTAALRSFRKFRKEKDIMLDMLDSGIMEAYEAWHKQHGVVPNTISFYTRILRATYNRAVEQDVIENRYPFKHVYTGVDKTVKRALTLDAIKKIKMLDLSTAPVLNFARDMFLMSFYLRGMSFIDMAYLKKTALSNGYVTYRRRKTGQQLTIEWTKEMQTILDNYSENESGYLLPIITTHGADERSIYRNACCKINRHLKKIAVMAGITVPLTLYVARHSWASAARTKGIPLRVISEGMGHDSEATTQIYLASLDSSAVDRANSLIMRSIE